MGRFEHSSDQHSRHTALMKSSRSLRSKYGLPSLLMNASYRQPEVLNTLREFGRHRRLLLSSYSFALAPSFIPAQVGRQKAMAPATLILILLP